MLNFKTKYDGESRKLADSERSANNLEIQKKAMEKASELQRKQNMDKINQLNQ